MIKGNLTFEKRPFKRSISEGTPFLPALAFKGRSFGAATAAGLLFLFFVAFINLKASSAQVIPDPETIMREAGIPGGGSSQESERVSRYSSESSGNDGGYRPKSNRPSIQPLMNEEKMNELADSEEKLLKKYGFSYLDADRDKVKLSLKEIPLKEIIEFISLQTGINLFLDTDIRADKPVTLFVENLSLRQILDNLIKTNGLLEKEVARNTYLIYPARKEREYMDLKPEVFFLEYEDPREMLKILKTKDNFVFLADRTSGVIVYDTPDKIEEIRSLIEKIDRELPQVEIHLELLEIERKKLKEYGIKLTELGGDPGVSLQGLVGDLAHNTITAGSPVLKLLREQSSTKILASPKIRLMDHPQQGKPCQATIQIGGKEPIRIYTTSGTGATGQSSSLEAQYTTSIQWQDTGVKMVVTVIKIHRTEKVTVKIDFEVTSIASFTTEGYPRVRTKTASTLLRLLNGETVVMGGLINNEVKKVNSKVPFLGDIPLVGKLFRKQDTRKIDTEIVMFVTPTIVDEPWVEAEDRPVLDRYRREAASVGTLGESVISLPSQDHAREGNGASAASADRLNESGGAADSPESSGEVSKDGMTPAERARAIFSELKDKYRVGRK